MPMLILIIYRQREHSSHASLLKSIPVKRAHNDHDLKTWPSPGPYGSRYMIKWTMRCCLFVKVDSCPATDLPVASPVCFSTVHPRLSTWSHAAARWLTAEAAVCWTFASLSSWTVTHISAAPGFPRRRPLSVIRRALRCRSCRHSTWYATLRHLAAREQRSLFIVRSNTRMHRTQNPLGWVSCSLMFPRVSNQRNMTARTAVWTFQH